MVEPLTALTAIFVLGTSAQWLANRLRLPSILLLLVLGFVAGPVMRALHPDAGIDPDRVLGDLLMPVVELSVAVVVFEGGLTLRLKELARGGTVIRNLVSIGALITWAVGALGARCILGLSWPLATLLGAILVVSGPTVVQPLLKQVRPVGPTGAILKWEGIVIDPIGVLLAVLVFDAVLEGREPTQLFLPWAVTITLALSLGAALGLAVAGALVAALRYYAIPDALHSAVTLMAVLGTFTLGEHLAHESGLFGVAFLGIALANQRWASIRHIAEFKENLTTLLLAAMFIVLAARVDMADLTRLGWESMAYLAVLILVGRPLAVWASTLGSELSRRERLFLASVAPRGIVAAGVSALFAIRLEAAGFADASLIASQTFVVIVGTVVVYGLAAGPIARRLGIAPPAPQGVLVVGGQPIARAIAEALSEQQLRVVVLDGNRTSVSQLRLAGIPAVHGNILDHGLVEELDLGGIGRMLALTSNDEANALAALHFAEVFGRAGVYQLAGPRFRGESGGPPPLRGRTLFGADVTYEKLDGALRRGAEIRRTKLTETFDIAAFRERHGERAVPLFYVAGGRLKIITAGETPQLGPGTTLLSLVEPEADGGGDGPVG